MKTKLLFIFSAISLFSLTSSAQTFSTKQLITTQNDHVNGFHFVDIDEDGDIDIIAASSRSNSIFWYKNLGNNTFASKAHLDTDSESAQNIHFVDIDEDGVDDILYLTDTNIYWIKNLGGGFFLPKQSISSSTPYSSMDVGDVDNDGRKDIIYAQLSSDYISWIKNMGGGSFTSQPGFIFNPSYNIYSYSFGEDVDDNGVAELVVSASQHLLKFEYSNGAFQQTDLYYTTASSPSIYGSVYVDLDNDGKVDILTDSSGCEYIWFKNFGNDIFSSPVSIDCGGVSDWRTFREAKDITGDGDVDLLLSRYNSIYLRENLGSVSFDTEVDISTSQIVGDVTGTVSYDIDNDGDLDVFYSSSYRVNQNYYTSEFGWFENTSPLSVNDNEFNDTFLTIYPNPTSSILRITSKQTISELKINTINGQLVKSVTGIDAMESRINIAKLAKGVYFLKVITSENLTQTLKFIKN